MTDTPTDPCPCCCPPPAHWTVTACAVLSCEPVACPIGPPDDGRAHPIPDEVRLELNGLLIGVTHWRREPDGAVRLLFPGQVEGPTP